MKKFDLFKKQISSANELNLFFCHETFKQSPDISFEYREALKKEMKKRGTSSGLWTNVDLL